MPKCKNGNFRTSHFGTLLVVGIHIMPFIEGHNTLQFIMLPVELEDHDHLHISHYQSATCEKLIKFSPRSKEQLGIKFILKMQHTGLWRDLKHNSRTRCAGSTTRIICVAWLMCGYLRQKYCAKNDNEILQIYYNPIALDERNFLASTRQVTALCVCVWCTCTRQWPALYTHWLTYKHYAIAHTMMQQMHTQSSDRARLSLKVTLLSKAIWAI